MPEEFPRKAAQLQIEAIIKFGDKPKNSLPKKKGPKITGLNEFPTSEPTDDETRVSALKFALNWFGRNDRRYFPKLLTDIRNNFPDKFTSEEARWIATRVLIDNLHRTEQRKLRKEAREFVKRIDSNWENYSTTGKQRAITKEANSRLNPRYISAQFEHDLKREYDLIDRNKRAGGMIRIPDLWREMKGQGYTRSEFEQELFRLENKRIIDIQTAHPSMVPEHDRKLGIPHHRRGHLNYVLFRYNPNKPMRR